MLPIHTDQCLVLVGITASVKRSKKIVIETLKRFDGTRMAIIDKDGGKKVECDVKKLVHPAVERTEALEVLQAKCINEEMIRWWNLPHSFRSRTFTEKTHFDRALLTVIPRPDKEAWERCQEVADKHYLGPVQETVLSLAFTREQFTQEASEIQTWLFKSDLLQPNHPIVFFEETRSITLSSGTVLGGRPASVLIMLSPKSPRGWHALLNDHTYSANKVWEDPSIFDCKQANSFSTASDFIGVEDPRKIVPKVTMTTLVDAATLLDWGVSSIAEVRQYYLGL
jgi:hypothetical protein